VHDKRWRAGSRRHTRHRRRKALVDAAAERGAVRQRDECTFAAGLGARGGEHGEKARRLDEAEGQTLGADQREHGLLERGRRRHSGGRKGLKQRTLCGTCALTHLHLQRASRGVLMGAVDFVPATRQMVAQVAGARIRGRAVRQLLAAKTALHFVFIDEFDEKHRPNSRDSHAKAKEEKKNARGDRRMR
jgi:hypothetical protein